MRKAFDFNCALLIAFKKPPPIFDGSFFYSEPRKTTKGIKNYPIVAR